MKDHLSELLGLNRPVAELSQAELEAHLAPFFPFTRPSAPANFAVERVTNVQLGNDSVAELIRAEMEKAKASKRIIKTST